MKALVIENYGNLDVLKYAEIEKPVPAEGQILVQVKASGLNPVDKKIREGHLSSLIPATFPRVLGGDVSGVVIELGEGVEQYRKGDEVYFSTPLGVNGGNAEYVVVDAAIAALKPKSLSHAEAATLPVVALTTVQALRDFANLQAGDKVLIHAGAGGVGSIAIQYAKHLGAIVYTTASAANFDKVKSLGADFAIDYRNEDFEDVAEKIGGFDIVLESVGHENYIKSVRATRKGGSVPSIVDSPNADVAELAQSKGIKTNFMLLTGNHDDLELISTLVDEGILKTVVGQKYSLEEAIIAHEMIASGKNLGKIVVENK